MAIEYTMKLFIENVVRPSCLQRKITLEPGTPEILDPLLRCKELKFISSYGYGLVLNNETRTRIGAIMSGGCVTSREKKKTVVKKSQPNIKKCRVEAKRCSFKECTKQAQKGGVCRRHRSRSSNANDNPTQQPEVDRINEAIKVFQSQRNPTGADWTHLCETLAPTAVDDVKAVGYMIKKEFSSGWFRGIVGSIRQNAAGGRTRRVYYEDGDSEDLSLMQLKSLPSDANDTKVEQCRAARGVQIKRDTEEFVTCIAANNKDLTPQPSTDVTPATPSCQSNDNSSRVQWPRSTTYTK
jgi:hypothetical protein